MKKIFRKKKSNETNKEDIKKITGAEFSETLKRVRSEKKLTQKQLADMINVSDRTISKWEKGRSVPDLITIQSLCNKLEISLSSIVNNKETFSDKLNRVKLKFYKLLNYLFKNIFIVIFFVAFLLLLMFFLNNYNTVKVYTLKHENKDIYFNHGYFFQTKTVNILTIENISIEKIDYEPKEIKLELYTYRSGDAVIIYEADTLNNIYIDENISGLDVLSKDMIESIKSGLFLKIIVTDDNDETYSYETKIVLNKRYTNNQLFYNDFESNEADDVSVNSRTSKRSLESLGYEYNEENNIYTKVDSNNGKIEYLASSEIMTYYVTKNEEIYNISINPSSKTLMYRICEANGENKTRIKILFNDLFEYKLEKEHKKHQEEIDYILSVYKEIIETLQT